MFRIFPLWELLVALPAVAGTSHAAPAARAEKPNVLIVFPDPWRRQAIGVNGDSFPVPVPPAPARW